MDNDVIKFNGSDGIVSAETITVYAHAPWLADCETEYECTVPLHTERARNGRVTDIGLAYGDVEIRLLSLGREPLPHDETPEQHRVLTSAARNEAERELAAWLTDAADNV